MKIKNMSSNSKNSENSNISTLQKIERLHPHMMLTCLIVLGVFLIFFFLIVSFLLTSDSFNPSLTYRLPKSFVLSTLTLLLSSFSVYKATQYYESESLVKLRRSLEISFALGVIFCLLQLSGWLELQESQLFFSGGNKSSSFLYLISGLHVLHLLGGMIFIVRVYLIVFRAASDPVHALITSTDPYEKLRVKMLSIYWHFMDILWILIFLTFLWAY
jgi:cytochrome c oxidase subunit 3